jgi:hypothetical protein
LADIFDGQGDVARARAELETAVDVAQRQGATLWRLRATVALADCLAREGEGAEAAALLEPLLETADDCAALPEFERAARLMSQIDPVPGRYAAG